MAHRLRDGDLLDGWVCIPSSRQLLMSHHKKWVIAEPPSDEFLEQFPDLPPMVAHLLFHRGLTTQKEIDEFLNPDYGDDVHDPFLFRDMQKAIDRVYTAVDNKERIVVHGDYDADGVPAAAILYQTIKHLGGDVEVFIPHRETDGYGLNVNTVELLHHDDTKLLITCDCGISNKDAVARANELGMDVIITDHHSIPPELPEAYAIIHPKIEGEKYPYKDLAGGGVAFKMVEAMVQGRRDQFEDPDTFIKWQLDCVAISTITDMVPLLGENRTLVKYGLVVLDRSRRKGLQALYDTANMKHPITTISVGFGIGPRLNAAGRMNHANTAFELLVTDDEEEARRLAIELDATNKERQDLVKEIVAEAKKQIKESGTEEESAIVAWSEQWPAGVTGLIASRLADRFGRPAFVLTKRNGSWAGSTRSTKYFDVMKELDQLRGKTFLKFGGHPQSAGFTLNDGIEPEQFAKEVRAISDTVLDEKEMVQEVQIDAEIELRDLDWDVYDLLAAFEPFGIANKRPVFFATTLTVDSRATIGKSDQHLRFFLKDATSDPSTGSGELKKWKAMGFSLAKDLEDIAEGDVVDCVFEIDKDEWNGRRELMLKVIDMRKI